MFLDIYIPAKTISVNSMYYNDKRMGKTPAAQDFCNTVFNSVNNQAEDFKRLRNHFDPTKHVYRMYIKFLTPIAFYYTKQGTMSNKMVDISNGEKILIDCLMLKKFYVDNNVENLCTDDRYLQYMESKKVPTERYWGINVKIEIVDKPSPEPA